MVRMKICSFLTTIRRNHLPIVSILGCISCVYILSQKKEAFSEQIAIESRDFSDVFNRAKYFAAKTLHNDDAVPLILDTKDQNVVQENIPKEKEPDPVASDPQPEVQQGQEEVQQVPVQIAQDPGSPVVSYKDPERVEFPGYEQCAQVDFQPEHAMPLVALALYMSSGDVVIRQRLQAATGIYTGTWDEAEAGYPRTKSGVFLGSTIDYKLGKTVAAKTQIARPDHIVTFEGGALLIIRNPHTMLISEYIRRKKETDPTKTWTPEEISGWFQLPDWKTFFDTECGNWRSFAIQWVTYAKRLLIVSYEYFFEQPVQETTRMIVFLNVQQNDERISCSIQAYPNDHISNSLTFDPYTDEMKQMINTYVQEVNQTIITRGLRPLPAWKNTF